MILSTKGRYGVRAVFEVAINQQDGPVSIKTIAANQNLSELYLEQLFSKLKSNGIIKSVRGYKGGYLLNRQPDEITIGNILRALEGPLAPAECVMADWECENSESCIMHGVWQKIYDGINGVVDSMTIQDLVSDYEKSRLICEKQRLEK